MFDVQKILNCVIHRRLQIYCINHQSPLVSKVKIPPLTKISFHHDAIWLQKHVLVQCPHEWSNNINGSCPKPLSKSPFSQHKKKSQKSYENEEKWISFASKIHLMAQISKPFFYLFIFWHFEERASRMGNAERHLFSLDCCLVLYLVSTHCSKIK